MGSGSGAPRRGSQVGGVVARAEVKAAAPGSEASPKAGAETTAHAEGGVATEPRPTAQAQTSRRRETRPARTRRDSV